jgi:hypothetical protein
VTLSGSFIAKNKLWIALVLVVLVSWWVSGFDDETAQGSSQDKGKSARNGNSTARKSASTKADQRAPAEALALIDRGFRPRTAMDQLSDDPFTVVSFEPPPPPPPPPPKPTAPPLTFKYLGALRDGDDVNGGSDANNAGGAATQKERAVFLDAGGQLLIARKGDTLAGQYRVLEISDTSMQFEYLPLAERQTLNFGR